MPGRSDKLFRLQEEADDGELPYISKSRVTTLMTCETKFAAKYIYGNRGPDTIHLRKGGHLHQAFEDFHEAWDGQQVPATREALVDLLLSLIPSSTEVLWGRWANPHISNFINFEIARIRSCGMDYLEAPTVEEELWWDDAGQDGNVPSESPPWMGLADVMYDASEFPWGDFGDDGVVILDYKTGKTTETKWRWDGGIHTELSYYEWLADENDYDVAGLAAYYPQADDLITLSVSDAREVGRPEITMAVKAMCDIEFMPSMAEYDPIPLCNWADGCCDYFSNGEAHDPENGVCGSIWGTDEHHMDRPDRYGAVAKEALQ